MNTKDIPLNFEVDMVEIKQRLKLSKLLVNSGDTKTLNKELHKINDNIDSILSLIRKKETKK